MQPKKEKGFLLSYSLSVKRVEKKFQVESLAREDQPRDTSNSDGLLEWSSKISTEIISDLWER